MCVFKWQVINWMSTNETFLTVCFQMTSASLDVNQWWKQKSRLWSTFFHCVFSSVSFNGCGVCNTFRWIENSLVLKRWNSFQKMGSTTTVWMSTNKTFLHCAFSNVSFNGCRVCDTFRWIENSLVWKRWKSFQKMGSTTTVWMLTNDEKWNLWCQNNLRKHEPFILHWKKRAKY